MPSRKKTSKKKHKPAGKDEAPGTKHSSSLSFPWGSTNWMLLFAFLFLAIGVSWDRLRFWLLSPPIRSDDKYARLSWAFPVGNKVEARYISDSKGAGAFAKTKIKKGETIMKIDHTIDALPSEEMKLQTWYHPLENRVTASLEPYPEDARPSVDQMMAVLVLLMEVGKGTKSRWHAYIEALPHNISHVAWYWTEDEIKCVVPRVTEQKYVETQQLTLKNFHAAFDVVWNDLPSLVDMPLSTHGELYQKAEWAFLMVCTRAFGGILLPILDMLNHDPTRSVSNFKIESASHLVATRDIDAGEQVFNSYNKLTPSNMAESYGYIDFNAAYVNAPSITRALRESPNTRDIEQCTQNDMLFFGNVPEGRVEARFGHLHQTTYYKAFHPGQLVYQCVRVLLQSENGPTLGRYLAEKLSEDMNAYETMANAEHCQGEEGNYPFIRQVNQVTARLLKGAHEVARLAARGEAEYPGVPYP